jgi:hypothetical protein
MDSASFYGDREEKEEEEDYGSGRGTNKNIYNDSKRTKMEKKQEMLLSINHPLILFMESLSVLLMTQQQSQ